MEESSGRRSICLLRMASGDFNGRAYIVRKEGTDPKALREKATSSEGKGWTKITRQEASGIIHLLNSESASYISTVELSEQVEHSVS